MLTKTHVGYTIVVIMFTDTDTLLKFKQQTCMHTKGVQKVRSL